MTQDDSEMATQAGLDQIRFDANGLVPAIAQQHDTGEVLMLAWMNRDSLTETLATGRVCYYSRSRKGLWRKGETSGQAQHLKELRLAQGGGACHTGRRTCFYRASREGSLVEIAPPLVSPETLYGTPDSD